LTIKLPFAAGENRGANQEKGFTTIQAAINNAIAGDTILVPQDIYYERVVINKTVSLIGEDNATSIIDGSEGGTVVSVTADNVRIVNLTIRNSGWGWTRNGIYVQADHCEIRNNYLIHNCHNIRLNYSRNSMVLNNVIDSNGYGIRLLHATECVAIGNKVSNCIGGIHLEFATNCTVGRNHLERNNQGIRMYSPCTYNTITANAVINNTYDGMIDNSMNGNSTFYANLICHNNFINNTLPFILRGTGLVWHEGYPQAGNHWSRYNGTDQNRGPYQNETGSDGIGDTPYVIDTYNIDQYPLMTPWNTSPVLNTDTGQRFTSIQEAIDSNATMDGHTLQIEAGYYFENVNLNKAVTLVGEGASKTFIDGNNRDSVVSILAENVSISGFSIRNSGSSYLAQGMGSGIFLDHTSRCSIAYCTVTDNRIGIHAYFSTNNTIQHNNVHANSENGIWLWHSGNNNLTDNTMSDNEYNFGVFGGNQTHFTNDVDSTNTVDGRPVRYLINAENEIISQADIGTLYLINCTNMTVQDLNLTRNGHGIFGYDLTNSKITSVNTHDNNYGIFLQNSSNNTVEKCHCTSDWVGIDLQDSNDNRIEDNAAIECEKGIQLYEGHRNRLMENTLQHNLYGIRLYSSSSNTIFHNNLIDNMENANTIYSYGNVWDNGCEGNYWSGYNGTDTDSDGVGDTYLPSNGLDDYPLVSPFMAGDVNHDGRINIFDVVKACASYMTTPSDAHWNPHADIAEPYGAIDFLDIVKIVVNYSLRWTLSVRAKEGLSAR
jgi:parallel beta-helix repeat protein